MTVGTGIFGFSGFYKKALPFQVAGRLVGTGDNLVASLRPTYPPVGGGVFVGDGFFSQDVRASPRASTAATLTPSFTMTFEPDLDEQTLIHLLSVYESCAYGTIDIWLNTPTSESWRIFTGRTTYSVAHLISGSAGVRGEHVTPIVEVRDAGALVETLAFVASSPGPSEFTLDPTADVGQIVTGDLSARVGKTLHAKTWPLIRVIVEGDFETGFVGPNEWSNDIPWRAAPRRVDYEADA